MLDLPTKHLNTLKQAIKASKELNGASFYIFGSRTTAQAKQYSDIDLGLVSEKSITLSARMALASDIEDTDLPYKVDVVDLSKVDSTFRKIAEREMVKII
jgi:uncharacterized protein